MKRSITIFLSIFALSLGIALFFNQPVRAVDILNKACSSTTYNSEDSQPGVCQDNQAGGSNPLFGPGGLMTVAIQILAIIIAVAAVIVIVIAGFRLVTSNGDANTISRARTAIIYAVVGIVVAALAQIIVSFVLTRANV